ncbi:Tigger transposable element-derived protein 4 [Araneus ventricosus]|uniref:Tigger transposable element-derived protein 4 n=1 Tax=Araneus ventricosus TaxID=182803 RepID=A0A4Y2FDJ2_ARAVE|nr:Tigger transposable element-derived protein 4 [Araneus ventricosus]
MRDKNVPISGPSIIEKTLQFAKALGYDEFRESNGWLEKFKRRHGIMAKVISGESKDVDDNDSENWVTETLSKILKDYKPENSFNADETALFFQCLSQKTLIFKKENCFGGKQIKARLSAMLGANMTGHQKLKPLVIGRSKNPRCFKGAKSLEVDYDLNKNFWVTSEICEKWVQKLGKRMIAECRKIALVFDNCPAHPKEINQKLKNVTVFYLLPNTTSKVQPMDQELREKEEINDDVLIDDFLSLDSEAETSETLTELNILDSVKNKSNTALNCDEDEDDEDGNYHDAEN